MAADPALAFSQNLVKSYIQFKLAERQYDLFERREKRYSEQLQANQRFAQEGRRIQQEQFQQTLKIRQKEAGETTAFRTRTAERLESTAESLDQSREEQMLATQGRFEAGQAFAKEDPRREFGAAKLAFIRDPATTPEQRASVLGGGTTINISAGEREKTAAGLATMDVLSNLRNLYDLPDTRTGPAVGRIDPLIGQIGLTSRNQEDFMAATSAFKNQIIKEITGAQMSEQEAKRIMKQVPDITDHPTRWEAKWRQSVRNIQYLQRRRQEIQSGRAPAPWVSPSEAEFGPRIAFPSQQKQQIDFSDIDILDLEGLFK